MLLQQILLMIAYSVMVSIFFFSGLLLFFMGLIGEYIGRIFLGICNNPQFVVRQVDEQGSGPYLINEAGEKFVRAEEPCGKAPGEEKAADQTLPG